MKIKLTTLTENIASYGYLAEWGLSILGEVDRTKVIMDTGLSITASHNAAKMDIDLYRLN